MKLAKFGGTSVGSAEAIKKIVAIVLERNQDLLVVSALSGITDALIEAANLARNRDERWISRVEEIGNRHRACLALLCTGKLRDSTLEVIGQLFSELFSVLTAVAALKELSPRSLDLIMSFGERFSAEIVAAAFLAAGKKARAVDARSLIVAEGHYGAGRPNMTLTKERLMRARGTVEKPGLWAPDELPVFSGFIASTPLGETITLGRGGSDYSASILGAAFQVEEIEIWTDVDGLLTSDPRKVGDAFPLLELSYQEAMELSHFGAKVIYSPTIIPAMEDRLPIRILNTFKPSFAGTVIRAEPSQSRYPVRGISSISRIALLCLQGPGMVGVTGIASRLFSRLALQGVNIILISQASSEQSICFACSPEQADAARLAIEEEFAQEIKAGALLPPSVSLDKTIIAVVGERMKHSPGIAGRVFHSLGRNAVNIAAIAQGSGELNISAVIDTKCETKALNAIHEAFFLAGTRSVNVILVGCGLVGGTLLSQIRQHRTILLEDYAIRINVVGIANSRHMLLDERGINLDQWKEELEKRGQATRLEKCAELARSLQLPNTVFVDCTASGEVPELYVDLLRSSIAIVTPNKRGNTGSYAQYTAIKRAASDTLTPYLYETTAGAALPVISTLHDLCVSGDRIDRIEAMLSGTIGYLFSNYDGRISFAELLRKAKDLGYTEPDPRDDLNAMDVARKCLILAREAGQERELEDIKIEALLPKSCIEAASTEAFFEVLEKEEGFFQNMLEKGRGKQLVYSATITNEELAIGLRPVADGDPLYGLRGPENAIAFTTERYAKLPLVVRGPGAGGEVTAGGLLADIVRVARSLVE